MVGRKEKERIAPRLSAIFGALGSAPDASSYVAAQLEGHPHLRIGRSPRGTPALLIKLAAQEQTPAPPIRLANLEVEHSVRCTIANGKATESGLFAIVGYTGEDSALREHFFSITESMLRHFPRDSSPEQVRSVLAKYIELFSALALPSRGSVQGLWAELFLISQSARTDLALSSWHRLATEKFDFSNGRDRVEVKSYSGGIRSHHFSLEQLTPDKGVSAMICSVNVRPAAGGISISTLRQQILNEVRGSPELRHHLEQQIATALGEGLSAGLDLAYDADRAHASLAWFRVEDIPSVAVPSPAISEVRFTVDLSDIPEATLTDLEDGLALVLRPTSKP